MTAPTVSEIRLWSQMNFARLGFSQDEKLQVQVDRAVGYVLGVTGQALDAFTLPQSGMTDAEILPLLQQAIQMRTEQACMQGRQGHVDSAASSEVVGSISVGAYSETRRDPTRRGEEKSLNTWPALESILWMLMTPDRYAYWVSFTSNTSIPAVQVEQMNWQAPGLRALRAQENW